MASENFVQPAIPRFDGYWHVVESGVTEPAAGVMLPAAQQAELDTWKLKDLKAKNYLFQAIDRSILETILCKDTSKHIWDAIKKKHQGNAKAKRVTASSSWC